MQITKFPWRNNKPGWVREIGLKNGRNPVKTGVFTVWADGTNNDFTPPLHVKKFPYE